MRRVETRYVIGGHRERKGISRISLRKFKRLANEKHDVQIGKKFNDGGPPFSAPTRYSNYTLRSVVGFPLVIVSLLSLVYTSFSFNQYDRTETELFDYGIVSSHPLLASTTPCRDWQCSPVSHEPHTIDLIY